MKAISSFALCAILLLGTMITPSKGNWFNDAGNAISNAGQQAADATAQAGEQAADATGNYATEVADETAEGVVDIADSAGAAIWPALLETSETINDKTGVGYIPEGEAVVGTQITDVVGFEGDAASTSAAQTKSAPLVASVMATYALLRLMVI